MSVVRSYDKHRDQSSRDAADPGRDAVREAWLRTDTADYWRHIRMYEGARAFIHRPDLRWLTVGDGSYGLDSIRLRGMGFTGVLPSDIGGALLDQAKSRGIIGDYAIENAESLSFADESFDLVLCKESYHHFPRPMIALYEMLRVAKVAVVLAEPRDFAIDYGPTRATGPKAILRSLATWIRDRRGKPHPPLADRELYILDDDARYEESGNYLYSISSRELEKVALGMNLPAIALKGINDSYIAGGEFEPASESSALFREMRQAVAEADERTRGGRGATNMLLAIIFKTEPDETSRQFLADSGWIVRDLPRNPHLG
jgi:SAM-dependent methyltransferase